MERLTKRLTSGVADYDFSEGCYFADGQSNEVAKSAFKQNCLERLADYEDTGLAPEEVDKLAKDWNDLCTVLGECGGIDALRELAEADKEGRLVVLPYKVGQRVFALLDTDKHISECEVKQIGLGNEIGFVGIEPIGARGREYGVSIKGFGKTVFLTREAAEAALEAMKK